MAWVSSEPGYSPASGLSKPGSIPAPLLPASFVRERGQSRWPDLGSAPDTTTHLLCELEQEPSPLRTCLPSLVD